MRNFSMASRVVAAMAFVMITSAPSWAQNADRAFAQCGTIADAAQRLACYDSAHGNAPAPSPAPSSTSRYPEFDMRPEVQLPALPPQASAFPRSGHLSATVVRYTLSPGGHFTVELDNGQVWKQNDADDATAQFRKTHNVVLISKGFWHSYDMKLNSMSVVFKVDRVR